MAKNENVKEIWLHLSTDGQDSPPKEAATLIQNFIERLAWVGQGKIASCIGRFYSMDRDAHWDRIEKAFRLMTIGAGEKTKDFVSAIKNQYGKNINDNYLEPMIAVDEKNEPAGLIKDNDVVIFFNIREDRARQITRAFAQPDFKEFDRPALKNIFWASLIPYENGLPVEVVFPPLELKYTLSQILSENAKKQFKIAETEKYAHVTYFFNGGRETAFEGEERQLVKSATAAHFNEVPEMKAFEIAESLVSAVKSKKYDFLLANLANADMVGHTGDLPATIKGIEALDLAVKKVMDAVLEIDGTLIITADHGNAELKINTLNGEINTEHTINPVPLYLVMNNLKKPRGLKNKNEVDGILQDVAATVLDLLAIPAPADMDGKSLLPILYK
jgi:2,3-bisphosphoglycerate-independent phosphoglycerate mutase